MALFENGVTEPTRLSAYAARRILSSQSLATSVSLLSKRTSLVLLSAIPRFTVPTNPRLTSFSTSRMRGSSEARSRSQFVTSGSGLASLMTTKRKGVTHGLANADSIHSLVSASPLYTGTMMSTG